MRQRKNNIGRWCALCVLILTLSAVLAVSPAFARYRTVLDPFSYAFQAKKADNIYLWSGKTDSGYTPLSGAWTVTAQGSELPILVTNGTGADHARDDLTISIRVAATEGIQAGNNLNLSLRAGEETYTGYPTAIDPGTAFFEDFGAGWIYRFLNTDGEELTWELEGKKLSEFSAILTCGGSVPLDESMVQIQVTAVGD